ncbi:DUF2510 domain-containing protein [Naasia sp. SYSU D00057]|uniref:DUF2510 domain-containing protein n=1 Tax=Naasia sp. SYSU D00057 TaxID=2817380 RepID=UPI001B301272|nr:DUF2510 domain-containing protein [Naasia sp. SYSU D00057]
MASTPTPSSSVPSGWYQDPAEPAQQRYWDGYSWTDHIAPIPDTASDSQESSSLKTDVSAAPAVRISRRRWVVIAGTALIALLLATGGMVWKTTSDAAAAEEAREVAAAAAAAAEAQQKAEAEARARDDQERKDEAERASRRDAVPGIEASVKKMAEEHVAEGMIDGAIIDVTCSPVGGGSTDDLTEQTTVFDCFVANEDNGDGTMSGFSYNATMNWSTGSYTYGFGSP